MKKFILVAFLFLTAACTSHLPDVTAISTRELNPNEVDLNKLPTKTQIEGQHKAVTTLFTFWKRVNLSKAVDEALDKGEGDLMLNAEISLRRIFIVIGFINTIKIKGDVVNTKAALNNTEVKKK